MNTKEKKYNINLLSNAIHTGNLLTAFFTLRRIRKSALARHLNRNKNSVLNFQKNSTIQTAILWEISMVLKHNFFMDIASMLPPEFTTDAPINAEKDERILTLEKQVELLTAERDVLLKAMK
jgi:hypothetical protein